jgi:hypothetical protein
MAGAEKRAGKTKRAQPPRIVMMSVWLRPLLGVFRLPDFLRLELILTLVFICCQG